MTTFVPCAGGCGQQLHISAPACPKCGAPQAEAVAVSAATTAAAPAGKDAWLKNTAPPESFTTYANVPWFRRRWLVILALLTITPAAGLIAYTGDVYYDANGTVKVFEKNVRKGLLFLTAYWVYTLFTPIGSTAQVMFVIGSIVAAVLMGRKK